MTGHVTTSSLPFQAPHHGAGMSYAGSVVVVFISAEFRRAFKRRPPG